MAIRFLYILCLKLPTFRLVKCQEEEVLINFLHSRTHMAPVSGLVSDKVGNKNTFIHIGMAIVNIKT